jgi:hypothetical protein
MSHDADGSLYTHQAITKPVPPLKPELETAGIFYLTCSLQVEDKHPLLLFIRILKLHT